MKTEKSPSTITSALQEKNQDYPIFSKSANQSWKEDESSSCSGITILSDSMDGSSKREKQIETNRKNIEERMICENDNFGLFLLKCWVEEKVP